MELEELWVWIDKNEESIGVEYSDDLSSGEFCCKYIKENEDLKIKL